MKGRKYVSECIFRQEGISGAGFPNILFCLLLHIYGSQKHTVFGSKAAHILPPRLYFFRNSGAGCFKNVILQLFIVIYVYLPDGTLCWAPGAAHFLAPTLYFLGNSGAAFSPNIMLQARLTQAPVVDALLAFHMHVAGERLQGLRAQSAKVHLLLSNSLGFDT